MCCACGVAHAALTCVLPGNSKSFVETWGRSFSANQSILRAGGGVFVQGFGTAGSSVLSLTGSVLRNVAGGAGGGLFVTGNVSVLLSSATLLDNTATAGQGGGLLVSSAGSVHLVGVDLSRNRALAGSSLSAAAGAGGALALIDCTEVSAVDCTLSENSAAAAGGAVLGRNVSVLSVASSKLSGNRARGRGGAIAAFAVESAQIYNGSRLSGNAVAPAFGLGAESSSCADADALSRGGAVWIGPGSKVALREVTAEGNEVISGQGGVVYIESGGTLTVLASDFTSNAATGGSVSAAGAIFLDGTARATIASSVFRNNSAHWGGVTASTGFNALLGRWDANLTNVTVVSNSAFAGGAWAVVDDAYSATFIPTCANCTVLGNTASGYGNSLASPPRSFFLSAPAVVRPGSAANLTVSLTDAWNQIIPEVPGAFFELGCVVGARSAPIAAPSGRRLLQAPSSGTEAAALLTTVAVGTSGFCFLGAVGLPHAVYANGAAVFENILLRGTPRTAVTLRVSVFGWPQGSRAPATSFRDVVVEFDLCGCGTGRAPSRGAQMQLLRPMTDCPYRLTHFYVISPGDSRYWHSTTTVASACPAHTALPPARASARPAPGWSRRSGGSRARALSPLSVPVPPQWWPSRAA